MASPNRWYVAAPGALGAGNAGNVQIEFLRDCEVLTISCNTAANTAAERSTMFVQITDRRGEPVLTTGQAAQASPMESLQALGAPPTPFYRRVKARERWTVTLFNGTGGGATPTVVFGVKEAGINQGPEA